MIARLVLFAFALTAVGLRGQSSQPISVAQAMKQSGEWFASAAGKEALANVLANQSQEGSWAKNANNAALPTKQKGQIQGTFDNGATTAELRLLAKAFNATKELAYRAAFLKGLRLILQAQYPTGGWPQYSPPPKSYHRHITFNDGTMLRLLELLRAVGDQAEFAFLEEEIRQAARAAVARGITCIVRCQIKINGRLTVWCAQHDEITLEPRPARAFELVSLSGAESAGLLRFLMSLEHPTPEVMRAVEAGAEWFESAKITGIRVERADGEKRLVPDPQAPPLWARFYEIETGRPIFCGRDGIKKYSLAEIEAERSNGYAWHGDWGEEVAKEFARWNGQKSKQAP